MASLRSPFRVSLYSLGPNFGPTDQVAEIDDARTVGASETVNDAGEFYMSLPYNHVAVSTVTTWLTRYRVQRRNANGDWINVGSGIVNDYDATDQDVIFYGVDFLGLFDFSITSSSTSYTSTSCHDIVQAELSTAINEANSRTGFITLGTIGASAATQTVISSFEPRLSFLRNVLAIDSADESVRSIIQVSRSTPFTVTYTRNQGTSNEDIRLEYGGLVDKFRFSPDGRNFATGIQGVGVKREGATVLYSSQTGANEATYGRIRRPALYQNIINQTALDQRVKREARRAARRDRNVGLQIRSNTLQPWDGYDLGDSLRVRINRGIVNLNGLYTLWGQQFIGNVDGSTTLLLNLLPKDT